MPLNSGDNRPPQAPNNMGAQPPSKLTEALPCPRCKSTNTKFCYYNNYNLAQPRHFCKACRRYWTQGGTLRNVPVGGGTRKNSKRSRSSSNSTSTSSTSTKTTASTLTHETDFLRFPTNPDPFLPDLKSDTDNSDLNDNNLPGADGNFFSLLSAQQGHGVTGYGSSFGYGLCEMSLEYGGRGSGWGYPGAGCVNRVNGGEFTWQVTEVGLGDGNEEASGMVDSDCFSWPGLQFPDKEKV